MSSVMSRINHDVIITCVCVCFDAVTGDWSSWSAWSNCSSRCSRGVQRRTRSCVYRFPLNPADGAAVPCHGETSQRISCTGSCTGPSRCTIFIISNGRLCVFRFVFFLLFILYYFSFFHFFSETSQGTKTKIGLRTTRRIRGQVSALRGFSGRSIYNVQ